MHPRRFPACRGRSPRRAVPGVAGPGTGKTTTWSVGGRSDRAPRRTPDGDPGVDFLPKAAADLRPASLPVSAVPRSPRWHDFPWFCYTLVRRFGSGSVAESKEFGPPLRLLTGPEQEFRVREILREAGRLGRAEWPDSLARAFPTRRSRRDPRRARQARQLGIDPADVVAAGQAAGRPKWVGRELLRRVPRRVGCRRRPRLRRTRPSLRICCRTGSRQRCAGRSPTSPGTVPRQRPLPGPAVPGHCRWRTQRSGGG